VLRKQEWGINGTVTIVSLNLWYNISMPRLARVDVGGEIYHVINRTNGRLRIFNGKKDYLFFEKLLLDAKEMIMVIMGTVTIVF
jgi:hypothetical protein